MTKIDVLPELKQILGAMIFGATRPITVREMRKCLVDVAEMEGGLTTDYAQVKEKEIQAALDELGTTLATARCGFALQEVAGGYRLQSDVVCGSWLRQLLRAGKPNRLSRPALETLAIIAYRQPVSKAEIESVRGVGVDHVIKLLMELQLVRIAGRSELPGRPFLYGTTHLFLEHFGLKTLKDLKDMDPMLGYRPPSEAAHAARSNKSKADAPAAQESVLPGMEAVVEETDAREDAEASGDTEKEGDQ